MKLSGENLSYDLRGCSSCGIVARLFLPDKITSFTD